MMHRFLRLIKLTFQPRLLKVLLNIPYYGYLKEIGWINSFKKRIPVDNYNNPLPWLTYSFINFISGRLDDTFNIFEFGSGNSTLWYAERVKLVVSIEHDQIWFNKIRNKIPDNVKIYYQQLVHNGNYSKFIKSLNKKFEIVIVDGRDRVNCIKNSIDSLSDDGILVLDNSEREAYKGGIQFLLDRKFKKIDFWGLYPCIYSYGCTTIFYKKGNCLDI